MKKRKKKEKKSRNTLSATRRECHPARLETSWQEAGIKSRHRCHRPLLGLAGSLAKGRDSPHVSRMFVAQSRAYSISDLCPGAKSIRRGGPRGGEEFVIFLPPCVLFSSLTVRVDPNDTRYLPQVRDTRARPTQLSPLETREPPLRQGARV